MFALFCSYEEFYFYLPQVQSNDADAVVFIDLGIRRVLRVVNLWVDPLALVGRIVDLLRLPLTLLAAKMGTQKGMTKDRSIDETLKRGLSFRHLVIGVSHHRGLPFSVHVFIPVIGLLSVRVWDSLRLVPLLQKSQKCKHMKTP